MAEPHRTRRRPATRKGRPTLTRELIAEHALRLAGAEGFPAVTMRRLAEDLRVTVRALYNYVEDRQQVVELATQLLLSQWEEPDLDPEHWEDSVRAYCEQMRALYRKFPRALLVSLDEKISVRGVHPARLRNPDAFLGLLRTIGLSRMDALRVHTELGLKLFGFALLIDHHEPAELSPVPAAWLTDDMDLPHLTEAVTGTAPSPDEMFEHITGTLVLSIKAALG